MVIQNIIFTEVAMLNGFYLSIRTSSLQKIQDRTVYIDVGMEEYWENATI